MVLSLRNRYLALVERFNAGELNVAEMWQEVEELHREGFRDELTKEEQRAALLLSYALDGHDPAYPPRSGVVGRLRDMWEGEPRYSVDDVKQRAVEVEKLMKRRQSG